MPEIVLGIGDWSYSKGSEDHLKTYALGSCVAVILYDPVLRLLTMSHIALPESSHDPVRKDSYPAYFPDSGIDIMIKFMTANLCDMSRVTAKVFGGACVLDSNNIYDIGKKNLDAVFSILKKNNIQVTAQDTGKDYSRTVTAYSHNGSIILSAKGRYFYF